jgi:ABC-type Fe3+-hydroxamate transport system substrate-binding protein
VVWYTLNPQEAIRDLKTDPQWRALKAVASGQPFSECWAWALPASWDSV